MTDTRHAEVAIIGGGVIGASIAWNLTRAGMRDVLIVERNAVGSGASALAAGLITQARSDRDLLAMVRATLDDIEVLEASSGEPVGFHRTGSLKVADRAETAQHLERLAGILGEEGVEASSIDAERAHSLVPWLDAAGASAILHVPGDGYLDGQGLAAAYARAARTGGAEIWSDTEVTAPILEGERLVGVETGRGPVHCGRVIDAAGAWAGNALGWFGLALAATPLRSHYWITAPAVPPFARHPIVSFPDARAYTRPEVGGLLVGIQEPVSRTYDDRCLPADLSGFDLTGPEDWDLLAEHAPALRRYIPDLDTLQFRHHLAGVTTYTPDGTFLIGACPGVDGLLVASGCCGTGVAASGGIGRLVRDLVLGVAPEVDAERFRPDRFAGEDPRSEAFIARCIASRANKGRRK